MVASEPPGSSKAVSTGADPRLRAITTHPDIGPRALDVDLPEVRRLHLLRIHYYLYYRAVGEDAVEVLALWHTSRGQGPFLKD